MARRNAAALSIWSFRSSSLPTITRCSATPRALKQRGELLRAGAQGELLDAWDGQLVSAGREIIAARRDYIARLSAYASEIHASISGKREALDVQYAPSTEEERFADQLFAARESDLRRMITSVGPHRDDLRLLIGGEDARAFGSQGQQRTAAISLKLSELHVMRDETGEWRCCFSTM